ncbi:MAG: PAS domain S-box protein [Phenylobacterium sp.]|uniref:PAS domain S-box protein n=1 Tax=Phenylobacterium sp. TaxID=1871053 RepID=UPI0039199BEF
MRTEDRESDSQRRLEGIVESAMDAIITVDEQHRIVLFNPAAERMFGVPQAEALGQPLARFIPERFRRGHDEHIRRFREAGVTTRTMGALGAVSGLRANGEEFPLEASISHVEVGGEHLATVILRDITERKQNEDARILLAREVDHRAKNALAVAQSLVRMTKAATKEEYAAAVEGRIAALARAHSLLSQSRWQGADLRQVIADEIAPYARAGQASFKGRAFTLVADAVQPVSLVFHELATNAVKHGGLKTEAGSIEVSWSIDDEGQLEICWTERDGPTASAPANSGFGTRLLDDVVNKQLQGALEREWRPEGLRATIRLGSTMFKPEGAARPTPQEERPTPAAAPDGKARRILVVEDETLLAMELASALEAAGWTVVGPGYSLAEGLALAHANEDLDAALLDVNLSGRAVYPLAAELKAAGVPFVFCTGYEMVDPEGRFIDAPLIRKPVNFQLLNRELARLVAA